jgi:hypothetical protein
VQGSPTLEDLLVDEEKESPERTAAETLREGNEGERIEMQRRTLLCGGSLAFIFIVARWREAVRGEPAKCEE